MRPVSAVAAGLGWAGDDRRGYPCPACNEATRDGRRGAVFVGQDGGWKCYRCDAIGGDGLDYLSFALTGKRLRDCADLATIKAWCGVPERAPREFVGRISHESRPESVDAATVDDIAKFWDRCIPIPKAHPFVDARRLHASPSLARFTPGYEPHEVGKLAAWPDWWPAGRARTWRLVTRGWRFPRIDQGGRDGDQPTATNLHARAVVDPPDFDGKKIKTLWAKSTPSHGLLFWNNVPIATADMVLVCEGLTDWLAASIWADQHAGVVVLGVGSGSASAFANLPIPASATFIIATDDDDAGNKYAVDVAAHFRRRRVLRASPARFSATLAAK